MRKLILLFVFLVSLTGSSQELNCSVVVNAQLTGNENLQIFKTMEKQLNEFVNTTSWTDKSFASQERIDCNMVINVTEYVNNSYRGTIQIQSARPVYGATYTTPIYNFNDKDFVFNYVEYQNMFYNPDRFESNLVSVIAFHINMVLGLDADSFELNGGQKYFQQAQNIANFSQAENLPGWKLEDGLQTRFILITNMLSPTFEEFHEVMYDYHRKGLDVMADDPKGGKQAIVDAIGLFAEMNKRRPNSFLQRTFFDAKSDEIEMIFSGGPNVDIANMVSLLNKIAPTQSSKWQNIKF